jgi:hypothetical protein
MYSESESFSQTACMDFSNNSDISNILYACSRRDVCNRMVEQQLVGLQQQGLISAAAWACNSRDSYNCRGGCSNRDKATF